MIASVEKNDGFFLVERRCECAINIKLAAAAAAASATLFSNKVVRAQVWDIFQSWLLCFGEFDLNLWKI
ncbi:hypothetical protein SLEP1_g273 [Rubroshorea leprosula]|uniref:Uncharacterized protein n=1 Tax=Rubroshorea leprosula TaxID=152421 RepID=A0AAV5HIR7_9ROSI|nr:hypothetical protein SLEP1_g273 [Rubroshorea leprosula]